jgi:hypothetical protein
MTASAGGVNVFPVTPVLLPMSVFKEQVCLSSKKTKEENCLMNSLKQIDQIAYIRFASVYRDFADITKLKQEVDNLARGMGRSVPAEQLTLIPENEPTVVETESRGKRK